MSTHPIYRVVGFQIIAPYTLAVEFNDGFTRTIDFSPALGGELFRPLLRLETFNGVMIDPEAHTLVWPNGADFDPATLHDWDKYERELAKRARQWDEAVAQL